MNSPEFMLLLYKNWDIMFISMIFISSIYILLFRNFFLSIFDPILFSFFFSMIGGATMLFLFFIDKLKGDYLLFYILTQGAFFIGILFFRPIKIRSICNKKNTDYNNILTIKYFYLFASISLIILQSFIYFFKGIPLFMESRLNIIGDDILFKFYNRLKDIFYIPVILLMYYFIFSKKYIFYKKYSIIVLLFIIISNILNGSKAALISLVLIYFVYALFSLKNSDSYSFNILKKHTKKVFLLSLLGAIVVVTLSEKTDNSLLFILYRIFISGDSYFMTFPYSTIENFVSRDHWFINLFASPLSLLGIIPTDMIPSPLGFDIMEYHNKVNLFKGPNPRHNILGYVYIGYYGSILFSFIIGVLYGFIRNKLFFLLPSNPIGLIIYGSFLFSIIQIEADFYNALASLINSFICMLFIFISYVFSKVQQNTPKYSYSHL